MAAEEGTIGYTTNFNEFSAGLGMWFGLENGMRMWNFSCMQRTTMPPHKWTMLLCASGRRRGGRALALSNYVFTMFKHAEAIPIVIFYNSLRAAGPLSVGWMAVQNIMGVARNNGRRSTTRYVCMSSFRFV